MEVTSACPLVELGLDPLVDKAMSRNTSRRNCRLRKPLSSLSADVLGCPTQISVWSETSQHWSLQAVGRGQVLMSKSQPPGELKQMNAP